MGKIKPCLLLFLLVFSCFVSIGYFIPRVFGWTPLQGHITQDTTLMLANSPYRVVEDVTVDAGVKLTIQPGVTVQFADGFSLIVNGTLNAVGTADSMINFTSSRLTPVSGVWNTIKFIGGQNESFTLKYSVVSYATSGITISTDKGYALVEACNIYNSGSGITLNEKNNAVIKNNNVTQNTNGMILSGSEHSGSVIIGNSFLSNTQGISSTSTTVSNVTISSNIISSNNNGIYLYCNLLSNVSLLSNTVSSNTQDGIVLLAYDIYNVSLSSNTVLSNKYGIVLSGGYHIVNVSFSSNTVSSNTLDGIYLTATNMYGYSFISSIQVTGNTVSLNTGNGIRVHGDYVNDISFSSNRFSSNTQNGIYFQNCGRQNTPKFDLTALYNVVSANAQKGVLIEASIRTNLTHNEIFNNEYGALYSTTSNNSANFNDIYRNTYGVNVTSGAVVNAENNYWGSPTGPYQSSLNPEGNGNPVNGDGLNLDFIPFLSSPDADFVVVASAGLGGTINPSGSLFAYRGSSMTFTISPNTGLQISDVIVDGIAQGPITSYPFTNIQSNHQISASFIQIPNPPTPTIPELTPVIIIITTGIATIVLIGLKKNVNLCQKPL
jgi:hypothetical protein